MSLADRLQRAWWQPRPTALARLLQPLAALYATLAARRARRDLDAARRQPPLPAPVIVIGNLVVGGAGKTPTVIALVQALRAAGRTPGIVSRGYGRRGDDVLALTAAHTADEVGDEPLLMKLRTGAPVVVGRDRHAAAQALCAAEPAVDVVLSDDGLQHLRLPRDRQVVVFDERGAGNGLVLPAGPLRQSLPARPEPSTLVLYTTDRQSTALPGWTATRRLAGAVRLADWWSGGEPSLGALHALRGREVWAAAGLAAPERFFRMLEAEGLRLRRCPLPDHDRFEHLPWPPDAGDVLVTEKDAVKLAPARLAGGPAVWVVALDLRLPPPFVAALLDGLPARRAPAA